MRAVVVVLGDIDRSPRMRYHAQALAAQGVDVDLVGSASASASSAASGSLCEDSRVAVHVVRVSARRSDRSVSRSRLLAEAAWRGGQALVRLTSLLVWRLKRPDVIIVQNPPGVPVLVVAWVASRLRSAAFVIDWHNLTHSMLSLRFGPGSWLVRAVRWHEGVMGRRADAHWFVSSAMKAALEREWGFHGQVFRDRPAERFEVISEAERRSVRRDMCERLSLGVDATDIAMAVSPTSWTADEDFELLIDAAVRCEALIRQRESDAHRFPVLVILITGDGPLRQRYERRMATCGLTRVRLRTIWLESDEYPMVLAAADLGICLHRSASGLDLPMKIADMFGVGIPVCALSYGPCLSELVEPGKNGLLFSTAEELARQLYDLFTGFPEESRTLLSLARGAGAGGADRWEAAWVREVWPLLQALPRRPTRRTLDSA